MSVVMFLNLVCEIRAVAKFCRAADVMDQDWPLHCSVISAGLVNVVPYTV